MPLVGSDLFEKLHLVKNNVHGTNWPRYICMLSLAIATSKEQIAFFVSERICITDFILCLNFLHQPGSIQAFQQ
jgi:hypothetical protein